MDNYKKFLVLFLGLGIVSVGFVGVFNNFASAAGAATVVGVTSSAEDGTYKIGDSISITVEYSTSVAVASTTEGVFTLTLNSGGVATFSTSTATTTVFTYTVGVGHSTSTLDYASTTALATSSDATIITDDGGDGDAVILTLAALGEAGSLSDDQALAIDGVRPTVTITLNATSVSEAEVGDGLTLTLTFSEAMSTSTAPTIVFADNILSSGTLVSSSTAWSSSTEYLVMYTFADVNEEASDVTITISAAGDAAGILGTSNTMTSNVTTDGNLIVVDTSAPSALTVNPPASNYGEVLNVALASTGSTQIRYTLDSSTPSCSSGTAYSSVVSVTSSLTLKAIACDAVSNISALSSNIFTINVNTGGGGGSNSGGSSGGTSSGYTGTPAVPATPAIPGVSPATPATPAISAAQAQLTALITQLQTLIAQAQNAGIQIPASATALLNANSNAAFNRDMTVGSQGEDARSLQRFLNAKGFVVATEGPGSPSNETNLFGGLTRAALAKFQASVGISPASGYLGPITRNYLKSIGY